MFQKKEAERERSSYISIIWPRQTGTDTRSKRFYHEPKNKNGLQPDPTMEDYLYGLLKNESYKECTRKKFGEMFSPSNKIYTGYLPHPLTTDNAWIVGSVFIVKSNQKCLNALDVFSTKNYMNLKWKYINESQVKNIPELISAVFPNAVFRNIYGNPLQKVMIAASPLPLLTMFIILIVQMFAPLPMFILLPLIALLTALQIGSLSAFVL
ncbi:hypothetical protein D918_05214 [Trichuris suis]|nr:hypothetical protein D918_05214 [Trichuris suis]